MSLTTGTPLGPYTIIDAIGAGGMGEVYRATDERLGREVAIKILPEQLASDPNALALFRQEARTVASLSHPNVLALFDVGEAQGLFFAVTEFLQGETLRARLRSGHLPAEETFAYAQQIAAAMAACHQRGIVHRDLKPENVIVTIDNRLKILDFGVATVARQAPSSDAETIIHDAGSHSSSGMVMGTVRYMSPEQIRGEESDGRSDIFAFGIMLYEMLSGLNPFLRSSSIETMHAITQEDPPPLHTVTTVVSEGVSRLVSRCLAKATAERFQTAREVMIALESVPKTRDASSETSGSSGSASRDRAVAPSVAVLPLADLSPSGEQKYFCEGMAEELITALGRVKGLRTTARTSAFQFGGQDVDVRRIGDILGVDTVLEGSVRSAGNRLRVSVRLVSARDGYQIWSERFDRSMEDVFAVQDEISSSVVDALRVTIGGTVEAEPARRPTHDVDAYQVYLEGRHHWNKRTEPALERSVELFRQATDADPTFAKAFASMAMSYVTLGAYGARAPAGVMAEARAAAQHALEIDPQLSEAYAAVGSVRAIYDWAWADAARDFVHAISLQPEDPTTHQWYAVNCLVPQGDFEHARQRLAEAIPLDPLSLVVRSSLGITCYYAGDYDAAIAALQRTLDLDRSFGIARYFLGLAFAAVGDFERALREEETAIELTGRSPEVLAARGFIRAASGERTGALEAVSALESMAADRYVSPVLTAQVYAGLGHTSAALDHIEQAQKEHAADLVWAGVRPVFASLRAEPRFVSVLRNIGVYCHA